MTDTPFTDEQEREIREYFAETGPLGFDAGELPDGYRLGEL